MRNLFAFNMVTLDGCFEGPSPWSLEWHNVDAEFADFAARQLDEVDTLLFGRATYQGMAAYWSTEAAKANDPVVAARMNGLEKVVVSRTLESVPWSRSALLKGDVAEGVSQLKARPGRDIAVLGSADLCAFLLEAGLLDEVRLMVNPVVLGTGRRLFAGLRDRHPFRLLRTQPFRSGNVLLCYRTVR